MEVASFVEAHGLLGKPFLEAKMTGALLGHLSGNDMVSGGFCALLGDGLRVIAAAHLQFRKDRPSCAEIQVQQMDCMLMYAWLCRLGQVHMAEQFLSHNICGMGMLHMTPGDLLRLGCDNAAIEVFLRERDVLITSATCDEALLKEVLKEGVSTHTREELNSEISRPRGTMACDEALLEEGVSTYTREEVNSDISRPRAKMAQSSVDSSSLDVVVHTQETDMSKSMSVTSMTTGIVGDCSKAASFSSSSTSLPVRKRSGDIVAMSSLKQKRCELVADCCHSTDQTSNPQPIIEECDEVVRKPLVAA